MSVQPELINKALPGIPRGINIHSAPVLPAPEIPPGEPNYYADVITLGMSDDKRTSKLQFAEESLQKNPIDSIGFVMPVIDEASLREAIVRTKADKFQFNPNRRLIIVPDSVEDTIRSQISELPIIPNGMLSKIIKYEKAYKVYGFTPPKKDSGGMMQTNGLIIQRLIMDRTRLNSDHQHVYNITKDSEKIAPSPIKFAALPLQRRGILYAQKNRGVSVTNFASIKEFRQNPYLKGEIVQFDLEASDNVVMHRALIDNTLRSSSPYGQELINLITAKEYARVLQLPIGKVVEIMDLDEIPDNLMGTKKQDYVLLLEAFNQVLNGENIISLTPNQIKTLNSRFKNHPRLGQFLPSILEMMRIGLIDFDEVAEVERKLHTRRFQGIETGISKTVSQFMPENMVITGSTNTPHSLINEIDNSNMRLRTKPPIKEKISIDHLRSYDRRTGERSRDLELTRPTDERQQLNEALHSLHFYNLANYDLDKESADTLELEEIARKRLQQGDIVAILPAYIEPDTIPDVARYHQKLLPDGLVIAVSKHTPTREAASPFCSVVIDENEVMQHVNFRELENSGFLPSSRYYPDFGKGKTLLAGYLYALATNRLADSTYMTVGDTDVANNDKESIYYRMHPTRRRIPSYRYLEYLAAALALTPSSVEIGAIQPGKNGPEREGIMMPNVWERMINWETGKIPARLTQHVRFLRDVGRAGKRVVWPSPGDAMVKGAVYKFGAWDLSTTFDLWRHPAAYLMERGMLGSKTKGTIKKPFDTKFVYGQVADPGVKIEMGSIPYWKDIAAAGIAKAMWHHALDLYQETFYRNMAGLTNQKPALPPSFDDNDVKEWNSRHAGVEEEVITAMEPDFSRNSEGLPEYTKVAYFQDQHKPNRTVYNYRSYFAPSVHRMSQMGLIDWEGIRNVTNFSTYSP